MTNNIAQTLTKTLLRLSVLGMVALSWTVVIAPATAEAQTYRVCAKQNSELDFNTAILANARAKITNANYFGSSGTAAPETFLFSSLPTISVASLGGSSCDIFVGGGAPQLSAVEGAAVASWANAGNRFVVGGCDYASNVTCTSFGRSLTAIANGGVSINSLLSYNPLNCGGALGVATFGGASTSIGTLAGDSVLAFHNLGGSAAATTDSLTTPKFLFTADADMFGNSGSGAIGGGPTATTDQAKFVVNVFKYAADALSGRLLNPQCFSSYDQTADLSLTIATSNAAPSVNGQTTVTMTVRNDGPNAVTGVEAKLVLPAGYTVASQAGTGTYTVGTSTWALGALAVGASVDITLTLDVGAAAVGAKAFDAEIITSSLADPDSQTNSGFATDDRADGIADDDEATITLTAAIVPLGPLAGGGAQCDAGTDALFILDNSGSINTGEFSQMQSSITSVAAEFLSRNPNNRIAVAHYGGPTTAHNSDGGQYVYIERNFSNGALASPVRQFGTGGAYNASYIQDYMAGAMQRFRYGLDGNAFSTDSLIISPIKELDRATSNPLHVLFFTDALRDTPTSCCSIMIDRSGSAEEPNDGSDFTVYNTLKQQGATFSFVSFNAAAATAAAIASPGGTYSGAKDANPSDPDAPGDRRLIQINAGFALTAPEVELAASNICPAKADLELFKTVNEPSPTVGSNVLFTLRLLNNGTGDATNVVVSDVLPAGLTFVASNAATNGFNDGGASDDTYVAGTGAWTVGTLPKNTAITLQIEATVTATTPITNYSQVINVTESDPDSTPNNNAGPAPSEDDEAAVTITPTGFTVSGRVFTDNGVSGGSAHDGSVNGGEIGIGGLLVEALNAGGSVIAVGTTGGDGKYTLTLPTSAIGTAITVRAGLAADHMHVADNPGALPGLVNAATTDGEVTFTPGAASYTNVNFGEVATPTLTTDRAQGVAPGASVLLAHTYTATTSGQVTFAIVDENLSVPGALTVTLFWDLNCNGAIDAGDLAVTAPVTVMAGDTICLLARNQATAGAPAGAELRYGLTASLALTGTALTHPNRNDDRVFVGDDVDLDVRKEVRNLTAGGAFGTSNAALPGQILEYRVVFTNPATSPAFNVEVTDKTPVFTKLSGVMPSVVTTPAGMACSVTLPGGGGAPGYAGTLRWACTGTMTPGDTGEVRFQVQVDP